MSSNGSFAKVFNNCGLNIENIAYAHPTLDIGEDRELIIKFQKNQCKKSIDRLICSHLRLALSISRRYSSELFSRNDLVNEGVIGMIKAAKAFDTSRENSFTIYVVPWIKAEISEFVLKNHGNVKVATTKAHRKLFFNSGKLSSAITSEEKDELAKK